MHTFWQFFSFFSSISSFFFPPLHSKNAQGPVQENSRAFSKLHLIIKTKFQKKSILSLLLPIFLFSPFLNAETCIKQRVFMGIIIKNNDTLLPYFLRTLQKLQHDPSSCYLQLDLCNSTPSALETISKWAKQNRASYMGIDIVRHECNQENNFFAGHLNFDQAQMKILSKIKNGYLQRSHALQFDYCFISTSEIFLAPSTLNHLLAKNKPIITPLLRPIPEANDPFRNFFADRTAEGYYKEHPDYFPIADRQKIGTFDVPCASLPLLIETKYAERLNFGTGAKWDFIAFSKSAIDNHISQSICNEREFGTFLHFNRPLSLDEEKSFSLPHQDLEITPEFITSLFTPYFAHDPLLQSYVKNFDFDYYALYRVGNNALFYVDEIQDYIKSGYTKKGLMWEEHIAEILKKYAKPGTIAVDIGGHMGTHTLNLSRAVGPQGLVHVFEPQAKMFTELVINMAINDCHNIDFHRQALGNTKKTVELVNHHMHNEGATRLNTEETNNGEKVEMHTLDSLNLHNVSVMKIDVEGAEMAVLEGGIETIKREKPVLIIEIFAGAEAEAKKETIRKMGYTIENIKDADYLCLPIG